MRWTGAAWAAAGLIAGAVMAPVSAGAQEGDPVILGTRNTSWNTTTLEGEGAPGSPWFTLAVDQGTKLESLFAGGLTDIDAIEAWGAGGRRAIWAYSTNKEGTVTAQNGGTGSAVYAKQASTSATGPAIIGSGNAKGRGALFRGGAAQVRLEAASASTHPSSGQLGDLFLDKAGRLWLCKGGVAWVQLG